MNEIKHTISRRRARAAKTKARSLLSRTRPRLIVHRSNRHIYAQLVGGDGKILAVADSSKLKGSDPIEVSQQVGRAVAKLALEKKISEVVFDRKHYKYHGRVKAIAEGARAEGLRF